MEPRKNPKADIEGKRSIFLLVGLSLSLLAAIFVLQWGTEVPGSPTSDGVVQDRIYSDETDVPLTFMEPKKQAAKESKPVDKTKVDPFSDPQWQQEDPTLILAGMTSVEGEWDEDPVEIGLEGEQPDPVPFFAVESVPVFPGCEYAKDNEERHDCFVAQMQKFGYRNFRIPEMARQRGIDGRVQISFIIEKDGSVSNVKVAESVDKLLDDEAVRVINKLPKFTPAKQRGKPVRMTFTMPFVIKLR